MIMQRSTVKFLHDYHLACEISTVRTFTLKSLHVLHTHLDNKYHENRKLTMYVIFSELLFNDITCT